MAPNTQDLRLALHEAADEHPPPAPSDLLAGLRRERGRRRRRTALAAVAGSVAVAAAGTALLVQLQDRPAADSHPAQDGTGSPSERGWVLEDGEAPVQADGLLLLDGLEVPYSSPGALELPDASGDVQRYAVLWCQIGPDDPAVAQPALELSTADGTAVEVPCLPVDEDRTPARVAPVSLPPGEDLSVDAGWTGDVPARGDAVLGIYEEAAWQAYDFPGWPEPALPPPVHGAGTVLLGPEGAGALVDGLHHADARSTTVTLTSRTTLELWRGLPGRLEVDVDGVRVTDDGDLDPARGTDAWKAADPELRDGAWTAFTAGQTRSLALPDELLPAPGETRTATVTVVPRVGADRWQVAVLGTADGANRGVAPSDVPTKLPEWHAGLRLAATWQVPAAGTAPTLTVPEGLTGKDVSWAVLCPGGDDVPADAPVGSVPTAVVTVDGRRTEFTCATEQSGTDLALLNLQDGLTGTSVGQDPTVTVALEASTSGTPGVVAAYVPVPFEEFDFGAAIPPVEVDTEAAVQGGVEVVGTLRPEDLADDGTAELELTARTVALRLTTQGVGRVRLTVDGEPLEGLDDGWWTSWTDARVSVTPPELLHRLARPGKTLQVRVEGYEPGEVQVELLARRG